MNRTAIIGAEYAGPIERAAASFADHEGVDSSRVLRWVAQFANSDLALAMKVLGQIRFFGRRNIRSMTRDLYMTVLEDHGVAPDRAVFVPMTHGSGQGVSTIVRALRAIRDPATPRIRMMTDLETEPSDDIDAIVFLDDFAGSGDTLDEWWETVESLVRPLRARVFFAALIMTSTAVRRAEEFADAIPVEELTEADDILSGANAAFDGTEKRKLIGYCRATGSPREFLRGYADCGLLVAFAHSCPDNSLPILWFEGEKWERLFRRHPL